MIMRLSARAIAPVALSVVYAALGTVACFSERSEADPILPAASCSAPSAAAGSTLVFIRAFLFDKSTVRVKAGGSVAWVNCEPTPIPHTATADGGAFETGRLTQNASSVKSFPSPGAFPYHCAIHPGMKATVIVE